MHQQQSAYQVDRPHKSPCLNGGEKRKKISTVQPRYLSEELSHIVFPTRMQMAHPWLIIIIITLTLNYITSEFARVWDYKSIEKHLRMQLLTLRMDWFRTMAIYIWWPWLNMQQVRHASWAYAHIGNCSRASWVEPKTRILNVCSIAILSSGTRLVCLLFLITVTVMQEDLQWTGHVWECEIKFNCIVSVCSIWTLASWLNQASLPMSWWAALLLHLPLALVSIQFDLGCSLTWCELWFSCVTCLVVCP